jgi:hypothetical protein
MMCSAWNLLLLLMLVARYRRGSDKCTEHDIQGLFAVLSQQRQGDLQRMEAVDAVGGQRQEGQ